MNDASFIDGAEKPIRLIALDKDDLDVVSTLIQDAIAERSEMLFEKERGSFSLLLKRFRWEDAQAAQLSGRDLERVQSVLTFNFVQNAQYQGFDGKENQLVFDFIGVIIEENYVRLIFAGDAEIRLQIEELNASLSDVSRPYVAAAQQLPRHSEG